MPTYKEFAAKARERLQARQQGGQSGRYRDYVFTEHSRYKMRQYSLSEQKVRGVIRNPRRREVGIAQSTVAVMQPVSVRKIEGKDTWKQEIWVMFSQKKHKGALGQSQTRVISAWRYPGVSPERDPIPPEILRELEDEIILEEG